MANIISVVIRDIPIRDTPNPDEYITPLKVFLYTKKINKPSTKARPREMAVSAAEKEVTLSTKLDLKISLKVIISLLNF
jgi:hypothetical protein